MNDFNGWLVIDVALGVFAGMMVYSWLKPSKGQDGPVPQNATRKDEHLEEDWDFLWSNLSDAAKEEIRSQLSDKDVFRRARAADMWGHLWVVAPEEVKAQLRFRLEERGKKHLGK